MNVVPKRKLITIKEKIKGGPVKERIMTNTGEIREARVRAAQYVRMSSEHQYFSTETQKIAIAEYAAARGYDIVSTYADEGKSGLSLKGRSGLKQLLADAVNPSRLFDAILIYDVSRWGRFRDPDEAAHYEFLCRQAGIAVVYCAEPFENDFTPTSGILKNLKRVMAHEYSRELSAKLTRAHLQQARLGYKQGGAVIYGFRRQVVDANNNRKLILQRGQHKASREDHVRFALGTTAEQEIVRSIFRLYVEDGLSLNQIAHHFRTTNVSSNDGRPWSQERIRRLLRSELCIGLYLYNRTSAKLQARISRNPEDIWVRAPAGIPSLISEEMFARAQSCLGARRTKKHDPEKLLQDLRTLVAEKGYVSETLISATPWVANINAYKAHFGTLSEACRRIGYVKPMCVDTKGRAWRREDVLKALRALYADQGFLSCELIEEDRDLPSYQTIKKYFGTMGEIYALIGAPPKSHSEILKDAFVRRTERMRGSPTLRRPGREHFSLDHMIHRLKVLLGEHGYLSVSLIKTDPTLPSVTTIIERFGSVVKAYHAAGWTMDRAKLATLRNRRRYAQRRSSSRAPA